MKMLSFKLTTLTFNTATPKLQGIDVGVNAALSGQLVAAEISDGEIIV